MRRGSWILLKLLVSFAVLLAYPSVGFAQDKVRADSAVVDAYAKASSVPIEVARE